MNARRAFGASVAAGSIYALALSWSPLANDPAAFLFAFTFSFGVCLAAWRGARR